MTLSFGRNAASGSRLLLNSISAPDPRADQWLGLMPLPMNRAAKRLGGAVADVPESAEFPKRGIDSSQGRAMETPAPRSNVRRVNFCSLGFMISILRPKTLQIVDEVKMGITSPKLLSTRGGG